MGDSVSPEKTSLIYLFTDLVGNSGDFPTRLWMPRIELDLFPHFLAGSMGLYNLDVRDEACTVCILLSEHDCGQKPGDLWDSYRVSAPFVLIPLDC
jgi:hypothetical protein